MNISNIHQSNSSDFFFVDTEMNTDNILHFVLNSIGLLLSFPINSYVIWLIIAGAGNGLAAEIFILNYCVCEIILCAEYLFILSSVSFKLLWIVVWFLDGLLLIGHPLFECLICVERYLAVIHPVIFLKFKPLRHRLMCSAVSWVVIFASSGLNTVIWSFFFQLYTSYVIAMFFVFFSIQLFCCVAVLRALKQSGPGERGREREEENNMKRRAFQLILITTVTRCIIYTPYIIVIVLSRQESKELYMYIAQLLCALVGLVQPILFLNRVGKLNFIKCQ